MGWCRIPLVYFTNTLILEHFWKNYEKSKTLILSIHWDNFNRMRHSFCKYCFQAEMIYVESSQWSQMNCAELNFQKMV